MTEEINRNRGTPSHPVASVAILTKNEEQNIARCLDSLARQTLDPALWDLRIIDHLSTDRTIAIAREFAARNAPISISIDSNRENNLGRSRAWAISQSPARYVAFIDADCEAAPDWLASLLRELTEAQRDFPDTAAVGSGNVAPANDLAVHRAIRSLSATVLGHGGSLQAYRPEKVVEVKHLPTCNVVYDRDRVLAAGNFSDRFDFVCEDLELSQRLVKAGYRLCYVPGHDVVHHHDPKLRSWASKMFRYGRGQIQVAAIHPEHLAGCKGLPILASILGIALASTRPWTAIALSFIYFALISGVSIAMTKPFRFRDALTLTTLFACTHFCYAAGELFGVFEWAARKVVTHRPTSITAK